MHGNCFNLIFHFQLDMFIRVIIYKHLLKMISTQDEHLLINYFYNFIRYFIENTSF